MKHTSLVTAMLTFGLLLAPMLAQGAADVEFKTLINRKLDSGPTILVAGNRVTYSMQRKELETSIVPVDWKDQKNVDYGEPVLKLPQEASFFSINGEYMMLQPKDLGLQLYLKNGGKYTLKKTLVIKGLQVQPIKGTSRFIILTDSQTSPVYRFDAKEETLVRLVIKDNKDKFTQIEVCQGTSVVAAVENFQKLHIIDFITLRPHYSKQFQFRIDRLAFLTGRADLNILAVASNQDDEIRLIDISNDSMVIKKTLSSNENVKFMIDIPESNYFAVFSQKKSYIFSYLFDKSAEGVSKGFQTSRTFASSLEAADVDSDNLFIRTSDSLDVLVFKNKYCAVGCDECKQSFVQAGCTKCQAGFTTKEGKCKADDANVKFTSVFAVDDYSKANFYVNPSLASNFMTKLLVICGVGLIIFVVLFGVAFCLRRNQNRQEKLDINTGLNDQSKNA